MENDNIYLGKWEKRWHPLHEAWVVYAGHRNSRPWNGEGNKKEDEIPEYLDSCYLCPGNKRIHGDVNPDYKGVFVFDNDHPVVGPDAPDIHLDQSSLHNGLYKKGSAKGIAKVICYDPLHNKTLAQLDLAVSQAVFAAWANQMEILAKEESIHSALIFENKGEIVGVSNPHPHGQIYATDFTFAFVDQQLRIAQKMRSVQNQNIFEAIIKAELKDACRIVAENEYAVAFIPFFARYAFEVMIFPKNKYPNLLGIAQKELNGIASVFYEVIRRYDGLYNSSFPYVMSVYQSPINGKVFDDYWMHIHLQPPLRAPGLKKYLAGPEIGIGNFMADTIPEEKAEELRSVLL